MKILDKIREYFFGKKIKITNTKVVKEIDKDYYNAAIYSKVPLLKKYCVWSTYCKSYSVATHNMDKAYENPAFVKEDMSLETYIERLWWTAKEKWLNIIDINNDDIINKSKGVFKRPVKKWNWGFGINKRVFHPYNDDYINPILYINTRSIGWKPKYDYVCFEDNPQVWICLFKFFWFGYKLVSPVKEDFEDSYWEQMIWYVNYCDCDLKKAEATWYGNWDKKYLKNE